MPPFRGDYLDLFRDGPPAPEDFERYLAPHGFPEVAGRPGWFQALADPRQFRPHLQERVAVAGVHFTLFDPDTKKLPFHRSAAFMVHPAAFRMECLFRNPECVGLSARLFECARALASGQGAEDELMRLIELEHNLNDRFGLYWTVSLNRDGNLLDLPEPFLFPAFPAAPLYGRSTVRGRRAFARALAARRRHHHLKEPRQLSEDEYRRLLAVWDAREGWQGPLRGYDPAQAVTLRKAAERTGSRAAAYYDAFRLIMGQPYSAAGWLATIGPAWTQRQEWELFKRRGTGRKRSGDSDDPLDRLLRLIQGPAGGELCRRSLTGEDPLQVALELKLPARDQAYLRELLSCVSADLLSSLLDHLSAP
jgi:hypothetical protein